MADAGFDTPSNIPKNPDSKISYISAWEKSVGLIAVVTVWMINHKILYVAAEQTC